MAYIRKLETGHWQATVRLPNGRRRSYSHPLKGTVRTWAKQREAEMARGEIRDPKLGQQKIRDWYSKWSSARRLDASTRVKQAGLWRVHCEPEWGDWPLAAPTRIEAQGWATRLSSTKRARHRGRNVSRAQKDVPFLSAVTVRDIVYLMSSLYGAALLETPPLVIANPFSGLELPKIPPREDRYFEHAEAEALYVAIERRHGLGPRTLVEIGMTAGLRPGELYGLHIGRLDRGRARIEVTHVMTRKGLRAYPKSKRSHRTVPVDPDIMTRLSGLRDWPTWHQRCTCPKVQPDGSVKPGEGPCPGLVWSAPEGGPIDDGNFRDRIWYPSVAAALTCGRRPVSEAGRPLPAGVCGQEFCADPGHRIRRYPPQVMRHTAATWLVQDGVPIYDVQALLGHERVTTTERYAHHAPDSHKSVEESWERRRKRQVSRPDADMTLVTRTARKRIFRFRASG